MSKINPKELLELDPTSSDAIHVRQALQRMKKPVVIEKKTFRSTEIARILTSLFMVGVGMTVEYYFPNSKIVGEWSTGGSLIAAGAGILAMVFILLFANKGLDLYERYILINNKKGEKADGT